ncbi:Chromosome partition protein Smc [Paraliobacillus sp. PM-2]|uniref:YhgE/Pip domain-containing protein n=1 Tax=Paraliobacillus sp. PM-2 TaxID=1462524 RepID=UPI00061C50A7|nr:YhgE/Pip domain-containing protein [Paraliobacillus sp. PM-2]CQR48067.1 Chromosome partition protein Smc [Paraliobacillus sp. PM-2]
MKKIIEIVRTDWINIIKTPVAAFLIVALMVLPSLYAWFNLKASWDPYSNTSDIAIAVTNADQGTEVRGNGLNIGDQIIENLEDNDALGWTFVSKKDADQGVKHGEYYASIYIPTDFSKKIATLLEDEQIRPVIEYSVNEKINAIAPKMTSTGASTIVKQTSESFVEQVSQAVLTGFNEIGIELEKELPTIRNIENKVFALEERLPDIEALGNKAITLEEKLPEINKQAEKVIELQEVMPEIMDAADSVVRLNEKMPQIEKVGEGIVTLQDKMPEIKQLADTIIDVDKNFAKIEELVANTLQDIRKAQDVVDKAQDALPEMKEIAENNEAFAKAISDYLENNSGALDTVNPVLKQNILLYQQTASAVHQFAVQLDHNELTTSEIEKAIPQLLSNLKSSISSIDQSIQLLEILNQQTSNNDIEKTFSDLQALQVSFQSEQDMLTKMENNILNITDSQTERLIAVSDQAVNQANTLVTDYDQTTSPAIDEGIGHIEESAANASDNLQQAQEALSKVEVILKNTEESLNYGEKRIKELQERLPEIGNKIHQTAITINEKLDDVESGVNQAVRFYQNQFPKIKEQMQRAASFVEKDLPEATKEVDKVADFINNRLPSLEKSVHKIADIIQNDLPGLEDTVRHTADQIRQFEGNHNLEDIIQLLKNDIEQESDFLANPIELSENKVFPIPNYGSANSPFYTTLSLWVGALLLISLLTVDVHNREDIYKHHHVYFGRGLTFASIGLMQALIVTLGDLFILDAYVKEPVWFVLFAIFIGMVFISIVYTLVSVFGNVGKGLAIILLVLQLSGSGGTFPIQVAPSFFQTINPFLPFTYAISLLREAVGGMVIEIVVRDILVLFSFMIVAILFAILLKKPLDAQIRKVSEQAKKSGLIH